MKIKPSYWQLPVVMVWFLLLYFPVFYTDYAYTDEYVQLWMYGKVEGFQMFAAQGRLVTEWLFQLLFQHAESVSDLKYIRIFSLLGWWCSLPLWYFCLRKVFLKEGFPEIYSFWISFFLTIVPGVSISVMWASCLEMFLACTAGLVSGYLLYAGIRMENQRVRVSGSALAGSMVLGLISLSTYQNGIGCFFLPFLVHLMNPKVETSLIRASLLVAVITAILYFFLFRFLNKWMEIPVSDRTGLHFRVWDKLKFFFTKPLSMSFRLNYLSNEEKPGGYIIAMVIQMVWVAGFLYLLVKKRRLLTLKQGIFRIAAIYMMLGIMYYPSLLVAENYSSNRTTIALHTGAFIVIVTTIFHVRITKYTAIIGVAGLFLAAIGYKNARWSFLHPAKREYLAFEKKLSAIDFDKVDTVYFIRAEADIYEKKRGLTRSWDEFAVPSSMFAWVPEFMIKQHVFEKTGNREQSEKMIVKSWANREVFMAEVPEPDAKNMVIVNASDVLK